MPSACDLRQSLRLGNKRHELGVYEWQKNVRITTGSGPGVYFTTLTGEWGHAGFQNRRMHGRTTCSENLGFAAWRQGFCLVLQASPRKQPSFELTPLRVSMGQRT